MQADIILIYLHIHLERFMSHQNRHRLSKQELKIQQKKVYLSIKMNSVMKSSCPALLVLTDSLPQGELLSPCRCSGSVRCTHQPCLIKWISERGSWACELCYYKYQVIAISTKNPLQVSSRGRQKHGSNVKGKLYSQVFVGS